MNQQTMGWVLLGAAVLILALLIYLLTQVKKSCQNDISTQLQRLQSDLERSVQADILTLGKYLMQSQQSQSQSESRALLEQLTQFENRLSTFSQQSTRALEDVRASMERQLSTIRQDNNAKLDEMRQTVDEKLQKTLNDRMTESFRLVNDRLEQVYRGLGEMQSLARRRRPQKGPQQCENSWNSGGSAAWRYPGGHSHSGAVRQKCGNGSRQPQCGGIRCQTSCGGWQLYLASHRCQIPRG